MLIKLSNRKKITKEDVKALIEKCDVSLTEFALISGYGEAAVRTWLNGTRPCRVEIFELIELKLGVHKDYELVEK